MCGGFSLLEVVIAVAIFSTGLGGFSLLLLMSNLETTSSGLQTIATSQVRSLSDAMQLVPGRSALHVTAIEAPGCLVGATCSPDQVAGASLHHWQQRLARQLPAGAGLVCLDSTPEDGDHDDAACDGNGGPVIKVFWLEPDTNDQSGFRKKRMVARLPLP